MRTRRSYYVVLFLILVANVILGVTGGWRYALMERKAGEFPVFWADAVLLASLFIVIAPFARGRIRTVLGWPNAD